MVIHQMSLLFHQHTGPENSMSSPSSITISHSSTVYGDSLLGYSAADNNVNAVPSADAKGKTAICLLYMEAPESIMEI